MRGWTQSTKTPECLRTTATTLVRTIATILGRTNLTIRAWCSARYPVRFQMQPASSSGREGLLLWTWHRT